MADHTQQSILIGKNKLWQIIHNLYRSAKPSYGRSYTISTDWQKQVMADHIQSKQIDKKVLADHTQSLQIGKNRL